MRSACTFRKMVVFVFVAVAGTLMAGAADLHPFAKLGVATNGDFAEPLGFTDRVFYKGGLDLGITDAFAIGPELQFRHRTYSGTVDDVEYDASDNVVILYGNASFRPNVEWQAKPFFGAGFGFAHGSSGGTAGEVEYDGLDETKSAFHTFWGVGYGNFTVDFDVSRTFWTEASTDASLNVGFRF